MMCSIFVSSFMKISYMVLRLYENILNGFVDTIFILKITKGHNSSKSTGGVKLLVFCALCDGYLYLYKVS